MEPATMCTHTVALLGLGRGPPAPPPGSQGLQSSNIAQQPKSCDNRRLHRVRTKQAKPRLPRALAVALPRLPLSVVTSPRRDRAGWSPSHSLNCLAGKSPKRSDPAEARTAGPDPNRPGLLAGPNIQGVGSGADQLWTGAEGLKKSKRRNCLLPN